MRVRRRTMIKVVIVSELCKEIPESNGQENLLRGGHTSRRKFEQDAALWQENVDPVAPPAQGMSVSIDGEKGEEGAVRSK